MWLWRQQKVVLAVLWILMQLSLLWQHHGPYYVNDSGRYLAYGRRIAEEWCFEHNHNLRYIGYPLFVSFWHWLGAGRWGIVLGQIGIAALATACFYDALRRLGGHRLPALLGTASLILWRDTQQFNVYLLTESLFQSYLILSFWALVRAHTSGKRSWILFALCLVLAFFSRPNGFVVPAAGVLAVLTLLRQQPDQRLYRRVLLLLVLLLPLIWLILNKLLLTFTLVETYLRGEIIYGYTAWVVEPTEPIQMPPDGLSPVIRLAYFIWHNPVFFTKLALLKLVVFFGYAKTYYSWGHILGIVSFIYPCYWLAFWGARRHTIWQPACVFLVSTVLLQAFVVMMTVEDWDVRFLVPLLPCIFALAALEITRRLHVRNYISDVQAPDNYPTTQYTTGHHALRLSNRCPKPCQPCNPPVCTATTVLSGAK
ncbi:ArnT family glycosyltransferase [Hymenobacter profundi]|uniref:Glycosyltransferase family 39 protein n=1 Tax=Hymenobacter profundi TaxID=1982110 RepID=A0ABS6WWI2_9BACT|nr:glycosyltransferase family 39 protein [Hymenobacter profundi]MBW3127950.1 glycosyltransferase family 39 protein [Hymenobacter profundi]